MKRTKRNVLQMISWLCANECVCSTDPNIVQRCFPCEIYELCHTFECNPDCPVSRGGKKKIKDFNAKGIFSETIADEKVQKAKLKEIF